MNLIDMPDAKRRRALELAFCPGAGPADNSCSSREGGGGSVERLDKKLEPFVAKADQKMRLGSNFAIYEFNAPSGRNFTLAISEDGDVAFEDDRGRFGQTGRGEAHSIFNHVLGGLTSYVQKTGAERLKFSADVGSRTSLYDRMTKALLAKFKDYRAAYFDEGKTRYYDVFHKDAMYADIIAEDADMELAFCPGAGPADNSCSSREGAGGEEVRLLDKVLERIPKLRTQELHGGAEWRTSFDTPSGREFKVSYDKDMEELTFSDDQGSVMATGKGEAAHIFSHVVASVALLVTTKEPRAIYFSGEGTSRISLYNRLAKSLGKLFPGKYKVYTKENEGVSRVTGQPYHYGDFRVLRQDVVDDLELSFEPGDSHAGIPFGLDLAFCPGAGPADNSCSSRGAGGSSPDSGGGSGGSQPEERTPVAGEREYGRWHHDAPLSEHYDDLDLELDPPDNSIPPEGSGKYPDFEDYREHGNAQFDERTYEKMKPFMEKADANWDFREAEDFRTGAAINTFKTPSGRDFQLMINDMGTVSFHDQTGDHQITGKGEAHSVFQHVAGALVNYVDKTEPEYLNFSARGASRIRLYDRLAKGIKKLFPNYHVRHNGADEDTGSRVYYVERMGSQRRMPGPDSVELSFEPGESWAGIPFGLDLAFCPGAGPADNSCSSREGDGTPRDRIAEKIRNIKIEIDDNFDRDEMDPDERHSESFGNATATFKTPSGREFETNISETWEKGARTSDWKLTDAYVEFVDENFDSDVTGKGEAFHVFSGVGKTMVEYIAENNPVKLSFLASGESRMKLYDRLAKMLVHLFPKYKLESSGGSGHKFYNLRKKGTRNHSVPFDERQIEPLLRDEHDDY